MTLSHYLQLTLLAALWGSSFVFMRLIAPVFGPVRVADYRLLIGGTFLAFALVLRRKKFFLVKNFKHYLIIGLLNCAIPFFLYAYAALSIPASYSVVINATTPFFAALLSAFFLNERLTLKKNLSILCGILGVGIVARIGAQELSTSFILGVLSCLGAAFCYASASIYLKKSAKGIEPILIATMSQIFAGCVLLPITFFKSMPKVPEWSHVALLSALALLGGTFALAIFYRLVEKIGATKSLAVAFLIPVFGILWAHLFLGEPIYFTTIIGTVLVLIGTYSLTRA